MQKSDIPEYDWVCTDIINNIVCEFIAHKFNDTQRFRLIEEVEMPDASVLARIACEMADWLRENHYEKIF